jgi:hypothetical protein
VNNWVHLLKVKLQNYLNPAGVLGGFGYVPCRAGNGNPKVSSRNLFTKSGSWNADNTSNFQSHSGRLISASAGSNSAVHQLDGTLADAEFRRFKVSSWELFASRGSSNGSVRWDVGDGSAPTIGSGYATGTVNTSGSTSHALHWGQLGNSTIDPDADNYFQVAAPSSGNIQFDGACFYKDDFDCGVRVHGLGDWGTNVSSNKNALSNRWVGVQKFFQATPGQAVGAQHGKLLVLSWLTNEVGTGASPSTTTTQFKTNMLSLIDSAVALPSKPCVLISLPAVRANSNARTNWYDHVEVAYQIADERDHVAVIDFDSMFGCATRDNGWTAIGADSDGVHESYVGHEVTANTLFNVLINGKA